MAENEEKTEQPSEVRLKDARKRGQVAKSIDLVVVASLLTTYLFLLNFSSLGLERLVDFLKGCFSLELGLVARAQEGFWLWLTLSLPVLLFASVGAIWGTLAQIGFLHTLTPLKPDLKRIDPLSGIKKILSKDRLFELLKQMVKFSAVIFIIGSSIRSEFLAIGMLSRVSLEHALAALGRIFWFIMIKVMLALGLIALGDFFWQRARFKKSLRMSKSELKKEHKQQEGDPAIKQERRRLWRETLESISIHQVKNGSVVVVNPAHVAVTLLYDEKIQETPIVIAKGLGAKAKEIVRQASLHKIPVIRNVAMARDLWWVDINEEIPEKLFDAVAEILTFIYELSAEEKIR